MNYEKEKNDVLEMVKQMIADGQVAQEVAEKYFPQLKESEDEKIRKSLIHLVEKSHEQGGYALHKDEADNMLAWLEKHKPVMEEINGEDYGIDSLWHAQRILEKTLGEVEGYQTDDGILDHKAAITAVKKLREQKPIWTENDIKRIFRIKLFLQKDMMAHKNSGVDIADLQDCEDWLMKLYEKGKNKPKSTNIEQKPAKWSEEDEKEIKHCIDFFNHPDLMKATPTIVENCKNWLKSLRLQKKWKPTEEQTDELWNVIDLIKLEHEEDINSICALTELYEQLKQL